MTIAEKRRGTDQVQDQIEKLIVEATDPKDKAFLLIMNKIAISLDTNTYLTQGLSDEFKVHSAAFRLHEEQEHTMINKGKGGLRVGLYLIGIIQLLIGFIIMNQLTEVKSLRSDLTKQQETVLVHSEQLKTLGALKQP